ncbi:MAG TPA: excinuclease ABC subunit UvrA, partial [Gammaproteobacteria bacterium]|nr:excinuclease ABC subunit UvrA [Gammaproteobacteria bacterium]
MSQDIIRIRGARQNNLKNLDLDLPLNELIVVTGVSGSGKSSLAFDTVYSEGQRRYVETFSPYARQFLDRMDKPQVDRVEGIPPAIAIDQTNPVRTSRSTVGTMTELNDHLKLLFARAASLYCERCGQPVRRDSPETIYADLERRYMARGETPRVLITFPVEAPANFSQAEIEGFLAQRGYTRIHRRREKRVEVVQDRLVLKPENRARIIEDLEAALKFGAGHAAVVPMEDHDAEARFSSGLHCADCDRAYSEPVPNSFSFNSPVGACETCRGFGRTIGIDYGLAVPDLGKSLAGGAVKPFQSKSYRECQADLLRFAKKRGVPVDVAWAELTPAQRAWVIEGEGSWQQKKWYGLKRFFAWLEGRAYRMHIRVLLSKYRSYDVCPACRGARLKHESLLWRLGSLEEARAVLAPEARFKPDGLRMGAAAFAQLPGLSIHDVMTLPVERSLKFVERLRGRQDAAAQEPGAGRDRAQEGTIKSARDEAAQLVLDEILTRLRYLCEVGLGYLTLDRQSRTLSGGEVQRINLTTALGTSLVNTLFVLDEPSIGLHARDMSRVIGVLEKLRDAGNTLLVVEHDPDVMLAADRILDLGPGPGTHGGRIVFDGSPEALLDSASTLTAEYLRGERQIGAGRRARAPAADGQWLAVLGAAEHNLKGIDVRIPLQRLVCITGVSGSGKSTLVGDVLYNGLMKLKGRPKDAPGRHDRIVGAEALDEVVLVDQSPIGKTARSNPASFVGALEPIRKLFAKEPLARERGYTAGTFSFNSGNGRCPVCSGNGFEHVEMQFLSDVYLRCAECNGRRYRPEVLEVRLAASNTAPKSIADVLETTVADAIEFFSHDKEVLRCLEPLVAVGLDYMTLGQPVPTLSGGEAQRLKLASYLAKSRKGGRRAANTGANERGGRDGGERVRADGGRGGAGQHILFLFDEPTTGLHFADIAKLLDAFQQLLDQGHSVAVIEHNLDVIDAADWLIDLGPEGGDAGGEVVAAGTPDEVIGAVESRTGQALALHRNGVRGARDLREGHRRRKTRVEGVAERAPASYAAVPANGGRSSIEIVHAREHNLRNVSLSVPHEKLTVITGVSGSGKSTVAFDILFAEGQRRYLESLNAYARQFVEPASRPDVDAVYGIPPTVAIEQRTSRGGRKSTVATLTEIHHFLRLLFVKLGVQHCPDCGVEILAQSPEEMVAKLATKYRGRTIMLLAPLVIGRKGYYTELAEWARSKGYGTLRVDGVETPTDAWPRLDRFKEHDIELPVGELSVTPQADKELMALVRTALSLGRDMLRVAVAEGRSAQRGSKRMARASSAKNDPKSKKEKNGRGAGRGPAADRPDIRRGPHDARAELYSAERACPSCSRSFEPLDPRLFSYNSRYGWCRACYGTGVELEGFDAEQSGEEEVWIDAEARIAESNGAAGEGAASCPVCEGKRLRPEANAVYFRDRSIADFGVLSIERALSFFARLKLRQREQLIARDVLPELVSRLRFLDLVGLGYLSL